MPKAGSEQLCQLQTTCTARAVGARAAFRPKLKLPYRTSHTYYTFCTPLIFINGS